MLIQKTKTTRLKPIYKIALVVFLTGGMLGTFLVLRWLNALPAQNRQSDLPHLRPFRDTDPWNTTVLDAPLAANSDAIIETIGFDKPLHVDFGSSYRFRPYGIPYNVVATNQPRVPVLFEYESDEGPYPIPQNPLIEGGSTGRGDRHLLMVDEKGKKLYELFDAHLQPDGSWKAGSGAIFDLSFNTKRPQGWTSADAAGLPIFPGLVRFEEVDRGEIRHAIRFTAAKTRAAFISPATHMASRITDQNYPPMGMRVRLKASVPIEDLPPQARVIARALKKHGMLLADNGGNWFISGTPDRRWDDRDLATLSRLQGKDFEVVELGWTGDTWERERIKILRVFFTNASRIAKEIVRADFGLALAGNSRVRFINELIVLEENEEFRTVLKSIREGFPQGRDVADGMSAYPHWFDADTIAMVRDAEKKAELHVVLPKLAEKYTAEQKSRSRPSF